MKFSLTEYNVSPKIEERNVFSIQLADDVLLYNGQIMDSNKIDLVKNLFIEYRETIVLANLEKVSSYKGGRQCNIAIKYDDGVVLNVIGNTSSINMSSLYSDIKSRLIAIIDE